jgi:translation elongation factor EF-Tu-like GTPase
MGATFLVESTFTLTNRGFVIAGQVRNGNFRIGDTLILPFGRKLITGIEMGDGKNKDGSHYSFVGILLGNLTENELTEITNNLQIGSILEILNS